MRDNHEALLELINTFEKEGLYFCILELEKNGERQQFQFGISYQAYVSLKKVFQLRPFSNMPGLKQRYFFVPSYRLIDDHYISITVRVEQQKQSKQLAVKAPKNLVANLNWFIQLENWNEAKHLFVSA
jgi:hypothetical protein